MEQKGFLSIAIDRFEWLKSLGDKTIAQLNEGELHWSPDPESNSIAVIVQHLYGNMLSRFTHFLTTEGEKPDRNRDQEFVEQRLSVAELQRRWDAGLQCALDSIRVLSENELSKEVFIRGESHTVMEAIIRSLTHYAYHVGQMVSLGKQIKQAGWQSLSIPRGKSEEYNASHFKHKEV